MQICTKLKEFLDSNRIRYVALGHSPAYTAAEIAASAHIKGRNLVKCIIVNGDGTHYMVATTANQKVSLEKLRQALNLKEARIEKEDEFRALFQDCELGAMPPFGNLYGMPVIVDEEVYRDKEIAFNGGNHASLVKMDFADFERLVKPVRAAVANPPA